MCSRGETRASRSLPPRRGDDVLTEPPKSRIKGCPKFFFFFKDTLCYRTTMAGRSFGRVVDKIRYRCEGRAGLSRAVERTARPAGTINLLPRHHGEPRSCRVVGTNGGGRTAARSASTRATSNRCGAEARLLVCAKRAMFLAAGVLANSVNVC